MIYKETKRDGDIHEMNEEISRILQLVVDLDYPYVEGLDVNVKVPRLGGLFGYRQQHCIKAAWVIGEFKDTSHEATSVEKIYLLSGGYICFSDGPYRPDARSPQELRPFYFDDLRSRVLSGLSKLRQELESKVNK